MRNWNVPRSCIINQPIQMSNLNVKLMQSQYVWRLHKNPLEINVNFWLLNDLMYVCSYFMLEYMVNTCSYCTIACVFKCQYPQRGKRNKCVQWKVLRIMSNLLLALPSFSTLDFSSYVIRLKPILCCISLKWPPYNIWIYRSALTFSYHKNWFSTCTQSACIYVGA